MTYIHNNAIDSENIVLSGSLNTGGIPFLIGSAHDINEIDKLDVRRYVNNDFDEIEKFRLIYDLPDLKKRLLNFPGEEFYTVSLVDVSEQKRLRLKIPRYYILAMVKKVETYREKTLFDGEFSGLDNSHARLKS